jgi:pimeloyl-[acyl-carrier protein] synthase
MESVPSTPKHLTRTDNKQESGAAKPAKFNPFLPEFRADPYPFYDRLRSEDPVHWSFMGVWVITRYADAIAVLRDPRFSADMRRWGNYKDIRFREKPGELGPLGRITSKWILFIDPPDHTRLQRLASKAFTPQVVESLRPYIQHVVNEHIERVQNAGSMDIVADLGQSLPVIVIAQMLGVPPEDRKQLQQWSDEVILCLDPMMTVSVFEHLNQVILEFADYFRHLISKRRQMRQDDLLSALIVARDEGEKLSEEELLSTCTLLFAAGHETTVKLISNGMLALLRHPDQMEKLKQEPTLIQSAVEEMLRYDGPVQVTVRTATEDVEMAGKTIRKGQQIFVCLGAAHRDPAQFPDPERFDITRQNNRHMAFSYGIHACLGNMLARAQAQIAINTLIHKMPDMKLCTDILEWQEKIILRGLKALPVTFTPVQ